MATAVVYTINEKDEIVSEFEMDFGRAIQTYLNKRDDKGNRYHISVKGKDVPFKRKPKNFKNITGHSRELANRLDTSDSHQRP